MRYRKKPIEIEAVQFIKSDTHEIEECFSEFPDWLRVSLKEGVVDFLILASPNRISLRFTVKTIEGEMELSLNNWLIRGVKGELYPCNDEIFKMTYEQVE
jgi:hypothetical protein